ncbi:sulfate/thiosulfate import ATP-binding protein CysA [Planctomycetales bacterium]|nr:sulfate/thiosulfate import ATP-binding protein CysA [Planctomycetales bacterium]
MSIEVRNITKTFGKFFALDNISLTIPDGKLIALLGPSGSGKTTLLRIIAGLEIFDPHPGADILFRGKSVVNSRVAERQVGFVFQHYALFRNMNVFNNIAFGMKVRRGQNKMTRKQISDRVHELLHLIQLDNLARRYPDQLSGGQRQRVALARALAIEPQFLLLDEPFGALDAKVRQNLRRWLRQLHEQIKLTSIFVTHDQEEALELADEIVVMNQGHIEQHGTPDDVFHHPKTAFVMDFLGNVNLFHGRVEGAGIVFAVKEGEHSQVFVRPHEIELRRDNDECRGVAATIERVQLAGSVVKIELTDADKKNIFVEMSHETYSIRKFLAGDTVYAVPKKTFVFEEDYSI